jgi:hypothetical protein
VTTWQIRQQLGACQYGRCQAPCEDGADYCAVHLDDKRERNKKHMRIRRYVARVQLGLSL